MTSWQKRARVGVAVFGIAVAGLVYRSIREPDARATSAPIDRFDPKAILETVGAVLQQVRGTELEYQIESDRSLGYEDGSAKHFNIEITVHKLDGRSFVVTAREALAGPQHVELQLSGEVNLVASDGFQLRTERATFNQNEALARAPGALTFEKGRMRGSGLGGSYNQQSDVLQITQQAVVTATDEAKHTTMDGTAGAATFDRLNNLLSLDSDVRVIRGDERTYADHAVARLSADDGVVTRLELRGNARVEGGAASIESMRAETINMDYTSDGAALERVSLSGAASVSIAADEQSSGRGLGGESLDLLVASDGTVTELTGRGGVQLELRATAQAPARRIRASSLLATGEPGQGLTAVSFRDEVDFVEGGGSALREARSGLLDVSLEGDGIGSAVFSGRVVFTDGGLRAGAAEARYQPARNRLSLSGSDEGGGPRVIDEQINVEARSIDVTLDGRGLQAAGGVRTRLGGRTSATAPKESGGPTGRLPGLLQAGEWVSINADALDYSETEGRALYAGNATLVQGDTAVRGDRISLDRRSGDLSAVGSARSTLVLDTGRTDGRAQEVRYDEAARQLTYSVPPITPTSEPGRAQGSRSLTPLVATVLAQVSGPEGDLRAERIEVVLAREGNQVERLEAYTSVTMVLDARTAVGARLTYHAREQRYVMAGGGITPVAIRESCRETTGRTLTFFRSTDRIVVDGNETRRTETRPCSTPQSSR